MQVPPASLAHKLRLQANRPLLVLIDSHTTALGQDGLTDVPLRAQALVRIDGYRPRVGAPCGALYSGSDTGAPRQRSATARHRRSLVRGVRPARRRAVVRRSRVAEGPAVLDLLTVTTGVRPGDVVGECAYVRGLTLGRGRLGHRDLLDDHDAPSSPAARRAMAVLRAASAAAVSRL